MVNQLRTTLYDISFDRPNIMEQVFEKGLSCVLLPVCYNHMYLQIFLIIPDNQINDILQHI